MVWGVGSAFDHATHMFELDFGHEKQIFYSATVGSIFSMCYALGDLVNSKLPQNPDLGDINFDFPKSL